MLVCHISQFHCSRFASYSFQCGFSFICCEAMHLVLNLMWRCEQHKTKVRTKECAPGASVCHRRRRRRMAKVEEIALPLFCAAVVVYVLLFSFFCWIYFGLSISRERQQASIKERGREREVFECFHPNEISDSILCAVGKFKWFIILLLDIARVKQVHSMNSTRAATR